MKKGEITAFLSLIFVLLLAFILAMTESAAIQTSKNQKRLDVDRAVFSVFAEYQKDLLEEYEIFAFDSTYGTGVFDETKIIRRLSYYGSMEISQEITDIQYLTDNQGQAFREQILAYMEEKSGISLMRDLTGLSSQWEERETEGKEISDQLDEVLITESELLPEESESLVTARAGGTLSLILPRDFTLSAKSISSGEMVSGRSLNAGRGSLPARAGTDGLDEKLLIEQYVIDHFGNALEQKGENRSLDYELEYLIGGKESDVENLRSVANKLLFFRFAMNYAFLLTDTEKRSEAETAAAVVAAVLLQPEAAEAICQILLLLWSFGESVMDLRALMSGKRAAFVKNAENWQLSLASLFSPDTWNGSREAQDTEGGMTYVQYLQILLFLTDSDTLTMRLLDRVEQNLRIEKGVEYFRADYCVTKLRLNNTADIWNGITYCFPLYYGYL